MHRLARPAPPMSRAMRRLVLGSALLLAFAVWVVPKSAPVHAQETRPSADSAPEAPSPPKPAAPAKPIGTEGSIAIGPGGIEIQAPAARGSGAPAEDAGAAAGKNGERTITVEKGRKRVQVIVPGDDKGYESFGQFAHDEPALANMVVTIVAVVFFAPVVAIALVLWYRMRKAKMLNETMLKLAEKGVVPPAEALGALAGSANVAMAASPAAGPLYEQAKQLRRRTAWSDLRKGVIMGGIGLGLSLYSYFDDREANALGLVLLFVGVGYIVLWWFEKRQIGGPGSGDGGPAAGGPVSGA